jgi:D-alanyl-lipoteichoic acid acyltransferase DltB (MBOAT superfamily)
MLFNSVQFVVFFPLVTLLYFLAPQRARWGLLLAASCVFYMAFIPAYILILAVLIVIDYSAGIQIEKSSGPARKRWLILSIVSTCLALFTFKYFNFFGHNLDALAHFIGWNYSLGTLRLLLPIGLSFHTFQSLSYVIEVYRGNQKAEHHFGIYALYVMFYPQLVAGPIERPQHMLHQFREAHHFDYDRVTSGLRLMAWGFFKKSVIADRLAVYVNGVYGHPTEFSGLPLVLATVAFAYQIYCDFSGYSDIAIGSARVMGFELMINFKRPYFSASVAEFWKRWHISLSTWFRDYLYIPLGGNRVPRWRWYVNLLITFIISGLWHGANWTFVFWGALNGIYLLLGIMSEPLRTGACRLTGLAPGGTAVRLFEIVCTFALTCFAWIFFRANSLHDAWHIITHAWQSSPGTGLLIGNFSLYDAKIVIVAILVLEAVQMLQERSQFQARLRQLPILMRWPLYCSFLFFILLFGVFQHTQFIYFQF